MQLGRGTLGWLLFGLILFAPRIAGPLSVWLSQTTGLNIAPSAIVAGMIGVYVLAAVLRPAIRAIGRNRESNDTRLPTSAAPPPPVAPPRMMQPPVTPPTRSAGAPPTIRLPSGSSPLPGPPRFEPIIDPRVLTFGIIGVIGLGAFLLVVLFLTGSLP